eukprot:378362-Hanusia_phi.AAC.1
MLNAKCAGVGAIGEVLLNSMMIICCCGAGGGTITGAADIRSGPARRRVLRLSLLRDETFVSPYSLLEPHTEETVLLLE